MATTLGDWHCDLLFLSLEDLEALVYSFIFSVIVILKITYHIFIVLAFFLSKKQNVRLIQVCTCVSP